MENAVTSIPDGWHRHPNGGGLVQNTAHVDPTAYIGPDAQVFGNAQVFGTAQVYGTARVFGNARVYGTAWVFGNARVSDSRHVLDLPVLGKYGGTLWRTTDGHQLRAGCRLTTVPEARAALDGKGKAVQVWPDATPEQRRAWKRQWLLALDLCDARIAEWAEQ